MSGVLIDPPISDSVMGLSLTAEEIVRSANTALRRRRFEALPVVQQRIAQDLDISGFERPKSRGELQYHDLMLGTVQLTVPPHRLTVSDQKNLTEFEPIRSDQNIAIKSGYAMLSFHLSLVLAGEDINLQLRHLIAQYRACPFTTIKSRYLTDLLVNRTSGIPDAERQVNLRAAHGRLDKLFIDIRLLVGAGDGLGDLLTINYLKMNWVKFFRSLRTAENTLMPNKAIQLRSLTSELRAAIAEYAKYADLPVRTELKLMTAEIPVVYNSMAVYSIPEFPNAMGVDIQLSYFNTLPYTSSPNLYWKDIRGHKTTDMRRAAVFQKYYLQRFISDGRLVVQVPRAQEIHRLQGKTGLLSSVRNSEILGHWDQSSRLRLTYPTSKKLGEVRVYQDLDLDQGTSTSITSSVGVSIANFLSFQNVQASPYPTTQYMGGKRATFTVELSITDPQKLNEINQFRIENDLVSHDAGARRFRDTRIFVENPLINLTGIISGQLLRMEMTPQDAVTTIVRMEFLEMKEQLQTWHQPGPNSGIPITDLNSFLASRLAQKFKDIHADKERQFSEDVKVLFGIVESKLRPGNANRFALFSSGAWRNYISSKLESVRSCLDQAVEEVSRIYQVSSSPEDIIDIVIKVYIIPLLLRHQKPTPLEMFPKFSAFRQQILDLWSPVTADDQLKDDSTLYGLASTFLRLFRGFTDPLYVKEIIKVEEYLGRSEFVDHERNQRKKSGQDFDGYPDLVLPTYADFFPATSAYILEQSKGSGYARDLPSGDRQLLAAFIPSFLELGKVPSYANETGDLYRHISDKVEPDFFFWNADLNDLSMMRENASNVTASADLESQLEDPEASNAADEPEEPTGPDPKDKRRSSAVAGPVPAPQYTPKSRRTAIANEGAATARFAGGDPERQASAQGLGIDEVEDLVKHMEGITRSQYNRTVRSWVPRMRKAFPTYYFYFIFEGQKLDKDDRVMKFRARIAIPNAVVSINVLRHKKSVEVAEVEFTNNTGDLDNSRFRILDYYTSAHGGTGWSLGTIRETSSQFAGIIRYAHPETLLRDEIAQDENFYAKRLFAEGTRFVLKMGYASHPDDLETVFTGYIAEVTIGDVIRVVGQSYGAGLTIPVIEDVSISASTSLVRDTIKHVIDRSETEYLGKLGENAEAWLKVGALELANSPLGTEKSVGATIAATTVVGAVVGTVVGVVVGAVFGFLSGGPIGAVVGAVVGGVKGAAIGTAVGAVVGTFASIPSEPESVAGTFLLQYLPEKIAHALGQRANIFNVRGELFNVYAPEINWWEQIVDSGNSNILVAGRIGIDIIDEVVRRVPPFVWYVSIFDEERRLFVGRPDQLYIWTSEFPEYFFPSGRNTGQLVSQFELDRQFMEKKSKAKAKVTNGMVPILDEFFESAEFIIAKSLNPIVKVYTAISNLPSGKLSEEVRSIVQKISNEGLRTFAEQALGHFLDQRQAHILTHIMNWRDRIFHPDVIDFKLTIRKIFFADIVQGIESQLPDKENIKSKIFGLDVDRGILDRILAPIYGEVYSERTETNRMISDSVYREAVEKFLSINLKWRLAIHAFHKWLSTNAEKADTIRVRHAELEALSIHPRLRPFRDIHTASSFTDIVVNGIQSTRAQMANSVIVQYGRSGDKWETFIRSLAVAPEDRTVRIVYEPNIPSGDFGTKTAQLVTNSALAEAMRPIYRGTLILRGQETMKPYDVIYLYDFYNLIYGPVEIEQVVLKLNMNDGFLCEVTPHAFVNAYATSNFYEHQLFSLACSGVIIGTAIAVAALPFTGALIVGSLVLAAGFSAKALVEEEKATTESQVSFSGMMPAVVNQFATNEGKNINETDETTYPPLALFPLMRMGDNGWSPWVAGMKGVPIKTWWVRVSNTWENITTGFQDWVDTFGREVKITGYAAKQQKALEDIRQRFGE